MGEVGNGLHVWGAGNMAGMGDVNEDLGYMEKLVKIDWGEGGAYGELEVLYIF